MTTIICVDDNGGVMFNSRRQSQDKILRAKVLSMLGGKRLVVSPYTAKQFFPDDQPYLRVSENCYQVASSEDICFAEDKLPNLSDRALKSIILFKWNRVYPADRFFDTTALKNWKLVSTEDFSGNSHEKITMEVYAK